MYDKAIQLNPQNSEAFFNKGWKIMILLGNSLYHLKRYKEAIKIYDYAIQFNP